MLGLIQSGMELAIEVLSFIGDAKAEENIRKGRDLQLELQAELARPYAQQDDAKIVRLHKELAVYQDAARQQFMLWREKQK